jgi:thiol:disulfide interchange protein DsbD
MTRNRIACCIAWSVAVAVSAAAPVLAADAKGTVKLLSARSGVVPGQTLDLALAFELAEGWHIYWKNPGDSGGPPTVTWKLPDGFSVGPLGFPGPKRQVDDVGGIRLSTNILEGSPILTTQLTTPSPLDASEVTLEADVVWLICRELCVREKATVSLTLPVVQEAQPANEAVFARAARSHPKPDGKGTYVTVSAEVRPPVVRVGEPADLLVRLRMDDAIHIQSDRPKVPGLIATDVFVDAPDRVKVGDTAYPDPLERQDRILGTLSEFAGGVTVQIPITVQSDFTGDEVKLAGVVLSQACNSRTNQCFPPEYVAWEARARVEGAGAAPAEADAAGADSAARDELAVGVGLPASTEDAAPEPAAYEGGGSVEQLLGRFGVVGLLIGCFLYGLGLNATPCVFPLLSIKVIGFVQQAQESRGRALLLATAFAAGVLLFFVILGFLAAQGVNILQNPVAVIALGAAVVVLALSLFSVYTLQAPSAAAKLEGSIRQEGMAASFGKGALAPVLGFACTGPFMAGMFGWAARQEAWLAFLAFLFAGVGMASPYVLLGANPKWMRFLPKPGNWMITFERLMGFLLLGMVLWLIYPLVHQIGATGLLWTLAFYIALALACWVLGRVDLSMSDARRWGYRLMAASIAALAAAVIYGWAYPIDDARAEQRAIRAEIDALRSGMGGSAAVTADRITWRPWSPEAVEQAVRSGKTVFVDFTAAYCTTCKQNKVLAIDTPNSRRKMQELGVVPFQGDYTDGDPRIRDILARHNRLGVPLNLIYPAGRTDAPLTLPVTLTEDLVLTKLQEAGPSRS